MTLQKTSAEAYDSLLDQLPRIDASVLRHVISRGDSTCDEAEIALDMRHQTCSAAFTRLKKSGAINDTGYRRLTSSGRSAIVWTMAARDKAGNVLR
jgi:hypothetical protein